MPADKGRLVTAKATVPAITSEAIRERSSQDSEPEWLLKRRLAAWQVFEAMSMPNPLEEEWRRTDISGLDLEALLSLSRADPPTSGSSDNGYAARLTQIDGESAEVEVSSELPKGVIFSDLQTAARKYPELVEPHLQSLVRETDWKLQALQAAIWRGGAFVYVPRGTDVVLPLRLGTSTTGSLLGSHVLIVAEENSGVTVVQDAYSEDDAAQSLVSGAVEIICGADARVRFIEMQRWGNNVFNFSTIRARLDRGSELSCSLAGLGSKLTKTKLEIDLEGENSRAEILGLSFGDGSRHFDYNTVQNHTGPRTSSDLLFKAALSDASSEVWNGKVRIQKGASQSQAGQVSRNLLLSKQARAAPIPVLEIEAYDVLRCSHGASAGPVDQEQLFYLESRGIPPGEAERLLVQAFFQEIVDRVPEALFREQVMIELDAKIGGEE